MVSMVSIQFTLEQTNEKWLFHATFDEIPWKYQIVFLIISVSDIGCLAKEVN